MEAHLSITSLAVVALVIFIVYRIYLSTSKPANFPPGPIGLPIIGNLHQISQGLPFLTFEEWSKKWGPIVGFKLGAQNAVVIHDADMVHELIVKKGSVFSARPPRFVAQEHVIPEGKHVYVLSQSPQDIANGVASHPVFMRNDFAMRLRAVTKDYLIGPGLLNLSPMAKAIGMRLVHGIYRAPDYEWADELAQWGVTTPVAVMAGANVEALGKNFVHEYHQMTIVFEEIMVSGAADIIPFLRWMPASFGAGWKKRAPVIRKAVLKAYDKLMSVAKVDHGGSFSGLIPTLLQQSRDPKTEKDLRMSEPEIKVMMGGLLDAGFASTVATFETIVLALTKHPEVLRKVQAEVDEVLGSGAETSMADQIDRARLPYLHACVMEVLRWHATTPIPLPREVEADVEVRGYHIPKGTTVMTNVWTIQRDPDFYDEPERFEPERYMRHPLGIKDSAPSQHRKALYTFGFGRRECPGRDFFFQQMEVTMAQVIWALDFVPTGELDTDVRTGFVFGVASRPKPLQIKFVPRRSVANLEAEKRKADIELDSILGFA
ncbi:hypothetical protein LTR97_012250 [Elasticomyces elasticus]|uniref:Cytochrome P450 n=1 Tax=Elasticomyces elasticus TaxID=574655 RepID=A0AAN7VVV4_9PEZI|nr:hypothetical protein LTR97_012250 [Elasticomyces elasticus]